MSDISPPFESPGGTLGSLFLKYGLTLFFNDFCFKGMEVIRFGFGFGLASLYVNWNIIIIRGLVYVIKINA